MKGVDHMDTENKINETEVLEEETTVAPEAKDELKDAIDETLSKLRMQSMLLGAQAICQTILDKITVFERTPGSKSNNDHKRLIKDIKNFCEVGLSRKVNTDGTTEPIEETAQN
jgi:hypothetical protein